MRELRWRALEIEHVPFSKKDKEKYFEFSNLSLKLKDRNRKNSRKKEKRTTQERKKQREMDCRNNHGFQHKLLNYNCFVS